ncbi:amidase [Nostoc sp. ChiQUE01b]|uniref:amidase n=1 Tax=Nostoc sp. ChiQUE01b TaxID=3075376 RepID=UPI002AD4BFD2|nr:amidase [Nostoc sp. ChiQUE01b]MDZ8260463.1 amidase [Nostoc sp. ChiQUE01b]
MIEQVWESYTLEDIGYGINSGSIDPRELVEYFLTKIDQETEKDKIFTEVFREQAKKKAEEAYRRANANTRLSLYDGIPLVWKDNFDIKDKPTSAGLKILLEKVAKKDAVAYRVSADAGFICLGKTNMTELAFSGLGINPTFGTPTNPFDRQNIRVPGGSSSGSAIAVAKGLCCAGIGTDTGGSIRTPAAWNNLVGLKTTAGLISTEGIIPLSQTLDTVGFMTRCVEDAAILYHLIAQTDKVDLSGVECKGLNLIVCTNTVWDDIDPNISAVLYSAIEDIARRGAIIERRSIPEFEEALELMSKKGNIVNYEGSRNWSEFLEANPGSISPDILDRFHVGAKTKESDIQEVYQGLENLKKQYLKRTNDYTAILMPTVASIPPIISKLEQDNKKYASENLMSLRNTRLANLFGLCAISLPVGFTPSGLPVGLMLVGAPFSEVNLLHLASSIEKLFYGKFRHFGKSVEC